MNPAPATRKIVAVLDDLFFTVKILDAARRAGLELVCVKDEAAALQQARENPVLIIVDLTTKAVNAVELIRTLKSSPETRDVDLLGFVPHVQVELKQSALAAGADQVLPRSTFSTSLPAILQHHAATLSL